MAEKKKAPIQPHPDWEYADGYALQALAAGTATPEQQKRALDWIVYKACAFYEIECNPDNERLCAIFAGRRFVGGQIVRLVKLNITKLKQVQEKIEQLRNKK